MLEQALKVTCEARWEVIQVVDQPWGTINEDSNSLEGAT